MACRAADGGVSRVLLTMFTPVCSSSITLISGMSHAVVNLQESTVLS